MTRATLKKLPKRPKIKHHELFRSIMSEPLVQQEFFSYHLPQKLQDILDISTIKIEKSDFIDEDLKSHICDILFSCKLKDSDEIGYINLLLEHQTRQDPRMSFRILKYATKIWDKYFKDNPKAKYLPVIYPIIFSNAKNNKRMSIDFFDFFQNKDLAKSFLLDKIQLIETKELDDEELLSRTFSGTMEFVLKHGQDKDYFNQLLKIGNNIKTIFATQNIQSTSYVKNILCYNLEKIKDDDTQTFKQMLSKIIPEERRNEMRSVADVLYEEAIEIGIGVGRNEGIELTLESTAINMLKASMDIGLISKITRLSPERIIALNKGLSS